MSKKTIAVGVTGGIAAYKIADLVSRLTKDGFDVHVIMTESATKFVTPLTMRTLSANPVLVDMFDDSSTWRVQHIGIAEQADLMVIAPATANIVAKMACGLADDLLSTILLATRAPILVVPSMNTNMYENPMVQENLNKLKKLGYEILEPAEGELACGVSGKGRLPDIQDIYQKVLDTLNPVRDMENRTVLITAGATVEDIDPVRFITNRSTGRMGYCIAKEAANRGARVILVSGPTTLEDPIGVEVHKVRSASEMHALCMKLYVESDIVIGAAAVADYRPAEYCCEKMKKSDDDLVLRLTRNPDIIGGMGLEKGNRILVGFAAETNDVLTNGLAKLQKKNLDLLVANDVTMEGAGFGGETNIVTLLANDGNVKPFPVMSKNEVARVIIDAVANIRSNNQ